jgi:hypothetical protein
MAGFWVLYSVLALASAAVASVTLVWMLYAWRTPGGLERTRFRGAPRSSRMSFSLLVPGRHEEAVAGLGHFCRPYDRRCRPVDHARLVLGFFPYAAVLHSTVVARFGTGARRIEIRRVQR